MTYAQVCQLPLFAMLVAPCHLNTVQTLAVTNIRSIFGRATSHREGSGSPRTLWKGITHAVPRTALTGLLCRFHGLFF